MPARYPSAHRLTLQSPETSPYQGPGFTLTLPSTWVDRTLHVLAGPTMDGHQHSVLIATAELPEGLTLGELAEQQVAALERDLQGALLLMRGPLELADGRPARRAIFRWTPEGGRTLYYEQVYVLEPGRGLTLTASFTRRSRRLLGPRVEAVMRSLRLDELSQPDRPSARGYR